MKRENLHNRLKELGLTDGSHLNKLFKRYKNCNPTDFRKKYRIE